MNGEPITVFARRADPRGVLSLVRASGGTLAIEGDGTIWRSATLTLEHAGKSVLLRLLHDPDYYSEPNWSAQMNGMAGFFSRFPESTNKQRVLLLPSTFRFSLATEFDPEWETADDPRLSVLFAITQMLDGVLFTPSSLRDAQGRVMVSAFGPEEEDAQARWPEVIGEVSLDSPLGEAMHRLSAPHFDEPDAALHAPSPERVARRALALSAVTARAILEQEGQKEKAYLTHQDIRIWANELNLVEELEDNEWRILQAELGTLHPRQQIEATWRLEGLVVLAWALDRFQIPAHDQLVELSPLWHRLGLLDIETATHLLANATLRPREQIGQLRQRLFALNWRLRQFRIEPQPMDFATFAQTASFGPLDITGLPLIDTDLAIAGHRIDQAPLDSVHSTHSATHERHHAANWLWSGPARYSEVIVAT